MGTSPKIPAPGLSDKVSNSLLAAAFPLETKAHVLHLIAGTRLLINLSEQLCPNADRLSASCLLGVSTFKIAPLPDSRVEGEGYSVSFFSSLVAPGSQNLPPKWHNNRDQGSRALEREQVGLQRQPRVVAWWWRAWLGAGKTWRL